jgi:hypothetical protein
VPWGKGTAIAIQPLAAVFVRQGIKAEAFQVSSGDQGGNQVAQP